jgi:polar amino acid transport system substrate-binding protein
VAPWLAATSVSAANGQPASNKEPLLWGADAEGGAPYIFKDPKDPSHNIGFEVDLAEALSRELGRPIVFKQYQFGSLVSGLERGDFDFAMNGLEVTPDRRAKLLFSRPYYLYQQQLVVRGDESRIKSFEDLKKLPGIQVGTMEDTAALRILEQEGIPAKIYDNQVEPYTDLELGRIDAVLLDLPIAVSYALPNKKLKFAGPAFSEGFYAIALRKDRQELANELDAALTSLITSGELKRIYEKWNIWNAQQEKLALVSSNDVSAESRRLWTFGRYFPLLLHGAQTTVLISILSMMLAISIGLVISLLRLFGPPPLQWLAILYVEFFRGIPVLLLLYFLYYGLPGMAQYYGWSVALDLSPLQAAILGFGLNYAAFESEIYRAGIGSIAPGQWEAAASLGMSRPLTFRRIILPQAMRVILPPMTNDFVALFKDTSVVSVIAVVELTKTYQILSKSSMKYLEIGAVTAILYLVMSVPLGYLSRTLEARWNHHSSG